MGIKEAELWNLHQMVLQLESLIANNGAGGGPGATVLRRMLSETSDKMDALVIEQQTEESKKEAKSVRDLAIAYMVERETALNAAEKREYGEFLKKDFFTKDDFGSLEKFYTNSYDKLTDGGKAEMSTRVWEGVRKKEYEFIELPDIVKEKEAARLRDMLSEKHLDPDLRKIPTSDRTDFVREWDAGNKRASYEVLNRDSFTENVSLSAKRVVSEEQKVSAKDLAAGILASEAVLESTPRKEAGSAGGQTELKLDDVLLISNDGSKVEPPLPGSKGGSIVKGG